MASYTLYKHHIFTYMYEKYKLLLVGGGMWRFYLLGRTNQSQVSKRSNQPSLFDLIVQFVNFAFSAFSHFF